MMEERQTEKIEFCLEYQTHTELALCVSDGDGEQIWLPLSQIDTDEKPEDLTRGEPVVVFVPEWLAREEELI